MIILTRKDLESLLTMRETIEVVEKAFAELAKGTADVPLRPIIFLKKYKGAMLYMPAYLREMDSLAMKVVSVYEENIKLNLPTIFAVILVNDPKTGMPIALMEGGFITAMRTGAASGVATKYLARKDAKIVGVIGTGVQARTQLWAVCEVRDIEKAYAYDVIKERAKIYCKEMSEKLGIDVSLADNAEEVAKKSDILILATTAKKPVIKGEWIRPGTHINSIGWMGRDARELDSQTVKKSKLVVDSRKSVLSESGDIIIPIEEGVITEDHIYAELGEIIIGKKPGRISDEEITLWKSVGLAIQDAATANLAYIKAKEKNMGTVIELF